MIDVLLLSLKASLQLIGSQRSSLLQRLIGDHLVLLFVVQDDAEVFHGVVFELLKDVVFETVQVYFVGVGANLAIEWATRPQLPLWDLLVDRFMLLGIEKVPLRLLLLRDNSIDVLRHQLSAQLQGVVVLTALYHELIVFVLAVQSRVRQLMRKAALSIGVRDQRRQPLVELLRVITELLLAGEGRGLEDSLALV